ncbi:MAG: tail fiber domain-containing protein [Bacteroidia bacterium]
MKKIILSIMMLLPLANLLNAQNVGINNPTPAASALLDLTATDKGLLIPRLTSVQRNAISSPATSLLVFDITLNRFYSFDGIIWRPLLDNVTGWTTLGNSGTNPANNYLGTSDNQPLKIRVNNTTAGSIQTDGQTFMGLNAGLSATGTLNTAFGGSTLKSNISAGSFNSAFGYEALKTNNSGSSNSAFGVNALRLNTSGDRNTAFGTSTLNSNTTGTYNVAVGYSSFGFNTTGSNNIGIGYVAGGVNTTGNDNIAIGTGSLGASIANYNVAIGSAAMGGIATGSENTAIGYATLYSQSFNNANIAWQSDNVAVGAYSLYNNQPTTNANGKWNTAIGHSSLIMNTTGKSNTAIGSNAGQSNQTGNFNTYVGAMTGAFTGSYDNATSLGNGAGTFLLASNRVEIGNTSVSWIGGQVNWATFSDARIKDNVQHDVSGLDFINLLSPVTYNYNIHRSNKMMGVTDTSDWKEKYDIEKIRFSGFIAQEVEQAAIKTGYDFSGVVKPENPDNLYTVRYAEFVVPLVKAVQELSTQNEAQKQELTIANKKLETQEKIITDLLSRVVKLETSKK